MVKNAKEFVVVKDPVKDDREARKELLRLRFARALSDPSVKLNRFSMLRKFSARCLTVKRRGGVGSR